MDQSDQAFQVVQTSLSPVYVVPQLLQLTMMMVQDANKHDNEQATTSIMIIEQLTKTH